MEYTEEVHVENLLSMLEKDDPCSICPAESNVDICRVCLSFVGAPWHARTKTRYGCPCQRYGGEKAIKWTWLALEERGYLK